MASGVFDDLSGRTFGRLTAIRRIPSDGSTRWLCLCSCGVEREVKASHLKGGNIVSCGCYKRQRTSEVKGTHRLTKTRTLNVWFCMIGRCERPNNPHYSQYGKRDIRVCERWLNVENFVADMGHAPIGMTIDRIDNNKGYEPGNCRWATNKEQSRNKRTNNNITINGRTRCVTDWATEIGMSLSGFRKRLKLGWTGEKLLSPPSKP